MEPIEQQHEYESLSTITVNIWIIFDLLQRYEIFKCIRMQCNAPAPPPGECGQAPYMGGCVYRFDGSNVETLFTTHTHTQKHAKCVVFINYHN